MKLDGASVHRAGKAAVVTQDNPWRPASSAVTTHPNPAEARRRWRGERSKPVRLGVRAHHTRSLCAESPAQTEQWSLALPPGGSSSERKRSRPNRAFSATPSHGQRRCGALAEDPGRTRPRAAYPGAAAQTRVVSVAGIRLGSGEFARAFKGIICDDISEFESHMPSHAVGSLSRAMATGPESRAARFSDGQA